MNALFIFGAKYLIILSILLFVFSFTKRPRSEWRRNALSSVAILVLAYVLARIGSHVYFDPRPFVVGNFQPMIAHAADNGFPSDHMLLASALAASAYAFNRKMGLILWLIACVIGASRIYVGVHHLTDILGSIVIALLALALVQIVSTRKRSAIISA